MGRYGSGGRWSSSCWRRVMVGLRGRRSKRGWLLQLGGLTPSLESPDSDTVLPACTDYRYGSVTRYGPTRTPSNSHNTRRAPRRPHYFRDDLDLAGHSSTSSLSCSASPTSQTATIHTPSAAEETARTNTLPARSDLPERSTAVAEDGERTPGGGTSTVEEGGRRGVWRGVAGTGGAGERCERGCRIHSSGAHGDGPRALPSRRLWRGGPRRDGRGK